MAAVFITPLAFSACSVNSFWCNTAYFFTSTGGTKGFFVLLIITGICYTLSHKTVREKTKVFLKSVLSLCLFFGVLAYLNEHYTKPVLKLQRPSHVFMLSQTGHLPSIDSLYTLSKDERRVYFERLLKNNSALFGNIDSEIQAHWVKEAGFSFPSGHTFNAFLFAMIISYAIYFNRSFPKLRPLFFVPFVWALLVGISRVAVGAHSALDVSAGATAGILIAWLFLYLDKTRHWLTRKT